MKKDTGFYGIVQEYFETRILYGFYVYGDRLPSIQKLCVIFAMAPATIRSALGQLEKQGYIKVDGVSSVFCFIWGWEEPAWGLPFQFHGAFYVMISLKGP